MYRASEDGDNSKQLIEKILNKGPIISFIETKKIKRFGGFTTVNLTNKNGTKMNDPKAFVFSLDNKIKYKILKSNLAFAYYDGNPLVYGNDCDGKGIYLNENFLERESREDHFTRVYNVTSDYCLTNERNFEVEEVEIFQIQ